MASLLAIPIAPRDATAVRSTARAAPDASRHIPALDGIRGLAVLMVLVFHIFQVEPAPREAIWRIGYAATLFGQTGVDLFFVLSGFLITGILLDAKGSPRFFVNFYGRRSLRIFPLYFAYGLLMLVLVPPIVGHQVTDISWLVLGTFSANFALAAGSGGGLLGHFWSLAIEEQFYLVWPFAVAMLSRRALMRVCLGSLAVSAVLRWLVESRGISAFMLTPCRIDTLLIGAMLAMAARAPRGLRDCSRWAPPAAIAALAAAVPLCLSMRGSGSPWLAVAKYPLTAALYGAFLVMGVSASPTSWLGRSLALRPLNSLGKYSYGIYIYHPAMIHLVRWIIPLVAARLALPELHPAAGLAVRVVLIAVSSYAVARVSWFALERPFLSLKRHFEYGGRERPESRDGADLYKPSVERDDSGLAFGAPRGIERAAVVGEPERIRRGAVRSPIPMDRARW